MQRGRLPRVRSWSASGRRHQADPVGSYRRRRRAGSVAAVIAATASGPGECTSALTAGSGVRSWPSATASSRRPRRGGSERSGGAAGPRPGRSPRQARDTPPTSPNTDTPRRSADLRVRSGHRHLPPAGRPTHRDRQAAHAERFGLVDLQTGVVYPYSEMSGEYLGLGEGFDPDEDPDEDPDRWLVVRRVGSRAAYQDMVAFICL